MWKLTDSDKDSYTRPGQNVASSHTARFFALLLMCRSGQIHLMMDCCAFPVFQTPSETWPRMYNVPEFRHLVSV